MPDAKITFLISLYLYELTFLNEEPNYFHYILFANGDIYCQPVTETEARHRVVDTGRRWFKCSWKVSDLKIHADFVTHTYAPSQFQL